MKNSRTLEHTKIWESCNHPRTVTRNKQPAPGLYSRTLLESSPQLQLSNNSFGTQLTGPKTDPIQVTNVKSQVSAFL